MAWYDLSGEKETTKEYLARVKYEEIVCKKVKSFMEIVDCELLKNVQYRLVTEQSFNAIVVINYFLKIYDVTEIYIAVYRMNIQAVNQIKKILDEGKIKCFFVLSSFFRENKKYEKWSRELVLYSQQKDNMKVLFAWNHAKVTLIRTADNRHIVFEGSGNLSDNARIEQYIIEDNEATYNFHKNWITNIIEAK